MWAIVGAVLNRFRGGAFFSAPKVVRVGLLGAAFALLAPAPGYIPAGWIMILAMIGIGALFGAMWTLGWGSYMDLGRNEKGYLDNPECLDWLIGHEVEGWPFWNRWFRDVVGLMLRGGIITLIPGILIHSPLFAISGFLMPVAYEVAYQIPSRIKYLNQGPELGEFLFGALVFAAL